MTRLFCFFEKLIQPTAQPPAAHPPSGLVKFYWYFLRQVGWQITFLFAAGFAVAIIGTTVPVFIGKIVTIVSTATPARLLLDAWPELVGMILVLLILRPPALLLPTTGPAA